MPDAASKHSDSDVPNQWTIMFFFASDNALAPLLVSQLKAIKDAGFQQNSKVIVYFDSEEYGVPTKLYNVNHKRKRAALQTPGLPRNVVGDSNDSYVRNMKEDEIEPDDIDDDERKIFSKKMKEVLVSGDKIKATETLETFMGFCRENYQAEHYVLVLFGHGMIVGNDAFLPDEHPYSGVALKDFGRIVRTFADQVNHTLELVALHSCSMSSIEVAYELKGTAKYMMASQGLSFVGSWPYRQLLKKTFNVIKKGNGEGASSTALSEFAVSSMIEKLYWLSLFNAKDFWYAGYSADLTLLSLAPEKFEGLTRSIENLVGALIQGLGPADDSQDPQHERVKDLILLAHWESQSYWEESYTDIYDFCCCLFAKCEDSGLQGAIKTACHEVIEKLEPVRSKKLRERLSGLIIHSDNFGWKYQYSHGLSVYFPWSEPTGNADADVLARYKDYAFAKEVRPRSWLKFLETYFAKTRRKPRRSEDRKAKCGQPAGAEFDDLAERLDDPTLGKRVGFGWFGPLDAPAGSLGPKPTPAAGPKPTPASGVDCTCPTIKNYPMLLQGKVRVKAFSATDGALKGFAEKELLDEDADTE